MARDVEDGLEENLEDSSTSEDSSGDSSSEDVNHGSPGGEVKAVPYHRLQKEVWKRQELEHKLEEMQREFQELRSTRVTDAKPDVDPEAPDREEDPLAYAEWVSNRADRRAKSAEGKVQTLMEEQERYRLLNDMRREFDLGLQKFPGLQTEEYRDLAWEQFCIQKDKTDGRATAVEALQTMESLLSGYGQKPTSATKARQNLRGKPKVKTGERTEERLPAGELPKLDRKMSFRTRMDKRLNATSRAVLERLRSSDRRTSDM